MFRGQFDSRHYELSAIQKPRDLTPHCSDLRGETHTGLNLSNGPIT